ncbi:MAG: TetR/AcrR family transcriptional regulator, partial [Deltaproteobacteria bacterium]
MKEAVMIDMRQRIIEAAMTIAAQSGFTQATTKEIAKEADCSEGIIYHYFTSKHELFLAVIKENAEEFLRQLQVQVDEGRTAEDKLERLIDFHFQYFTGKINIFQILFGKSGDAIVPFPYVLRTVILPYQRFIEGIIKEGVR